MSAEADPPDAPPRSVLRELPSIARIVGQIVAPVTLVTGLLVFFGWSRTTALFGAFGIDPTSLGFSTTDYLLVTQDGLFVPGVVITLAVLVVTWVLGVARDSPDRGAFVRRPWVGPAAALLGGLALLNGVLAVFGSGYAFDRGLVAPTSLIVGVVSLSFAGQLVRRRRDADARSLSIAEATAASLVVALALFWAAADYSAAVGRQRAAELAAALPSAPRVVLYSAKSLGIAPRDGVQVVQCAGGESAAYGFRYSGLMLLLNSNGQYVFLPVGWTRSSGSAIAVPRTDSIRLDYRSAGSTDADLAPTC